jgi:hypothetical protein
MTKSFTQPLEPYVVTTAEAMRLGGWGRTTLYRLINDGELESFLDGRIRWISTASIREHIRKKFEQSGTATRRIPHALHGATARQQEAGGREPRNGQKPCHCGLVAKARPSES